MQIKPKLEEDATATQEQDSVVEKQQLFHEELDNHEVNNDANKNEIKDNDEESSKILENLNSTQPTSSVQKFFYFYQGF